MSNTNTMWSLLIILLLMCCGTVFAVSLGKNNYEEFDYRFPDKTLVANAGYIEYIHDINLGDGIYGTNHLGYAVPGEDEEYTAPDLWDPYMKAEDIVAMLVIQSPECPTFENMPMRVKIGDRVEEITKLWDSKKEQAIIKAAGYLHPYFSGAKEDVGWILRWNPYDNIWVVTEKEKEQKLIDGQLQWVDIVR